MVGDDIIRDNSRFPPQKQEFQVFRLFLLEPETPLPPFLLQQSWHSKTNKGIEKQNVLLYRSTVLRSRPTLASAMMGLFGALFGFRIYFRNKGQEPLRTFLSRILFAGCKPIITEIVYYVVVFISLIGPKKNRFSKRPNHFRGCEPARTDANELLLGLVGCGTIKSNKTKIDLDSHDLHRDCL